MTEFTKEFIARARQVIAEGTLSVKEMKTGDHIDVQLNMLRRRAKSEHCEYYYPEALDHIERLQARVAELEQEREQVCKWTKDLNSLSQVFGFDVYRYLSPHDKYDFIRDREIFTHRPEFCKDCGKRIKLAESEG